MTKSAKGTVKNPGKNVKQKSGLNRSILEEAWGKFFKLLDYKLRLKGGKLIVVPAMQCPTGCSNEKN